MRVHSLWCHYDIMHLVMLTFVLLWLTLWHLADQIGVIHPYPNTTVETVKDIAKLCRQKTSKINKVQTMCLFWGWTTIHTDYIYCQTSNISPTLAGNKIVNHSDVVGASPVGAAPTASSFFTKHLASMHWAKTAARRDENHLSSVIWCSFY